MRPFLATLFLILALGVTAEAKDKWFEAISEHFTVVSNGREGRAKAILEDLEQLRRLITEIFPAQRVASAKPAVFYLFKNEKSMRPFQPTAEGEREEWAGMYRPTPLRDIVLLRGDGSSKAARQMAFGHYMHLLGSYNEADYPVWLSNGLSRFYGNTEITNKRANIGKMRDEYRRVMGEFRRVPIRELFAVDHSSDYYRDLSKRSLFDAQSWALVHYLLIGQLRENGPQRLGQYLHMLRQGGEPLLAFQEAMGKTLDEIDRDVAVYIRKRITRYLKLDLPPLEMDKDFRITKLDDDAAEAHMGQLFMAARYYDEAETSLANSIEANPDQVTAYKAMAILRDRQGKSAEATSFLERAIRNGSTNPHVHLRHAQLFVSSHGGTASKLREETTVPVMDSLRLVIREAPELTDAARLFGFLALFHAEKREEGLQVATDALERDPGNPSLVFVVGQLYAKDGNYATARAIYQKLLDRELDPGFNASVRRQYDYADAKLKLEAQQAAAAARAAEGEAVAGVDESASAATADEVADVTRTPVGDIVPSTENVEVRGKLVRFDCTEGHRFIVDAGDLVYALDIVDLARVEILENGERVGTRDFYCGPLDELVVVRYIPAPVQDGAAERYGRLVAVDFIGS